MIARRFKGVPSPVIATGQLTASTIIMIPIVLIAYGPTGSLSASQPVWAAVLGLALLSTAFAYILYFNLVASAGATNASLVTLIVPASAVLLGFLFLGERLALFEIGGMTLIGLGLITIDGRLFGNGSAVMPHRRHNLFTTAKPAFAEEFQRLTANPGSQIPQSCRIAARFPLACGPNAPRLLP